MEFEIWGFGFQVQGFAFKDLECGICSVPFGLGVWGLGIRVQDFELKVEGLGLRVLSLEF